MADKRSERAEGSTVEVYRDRTSVVITWDRHRRGITIATRYLCPARESWSGYGYVQAFGVCLWHDTARPVTVGERGVW